MTDSAPFGNESVSCLVGGCARAPKARGLCATHYQRQRRTGDPNKVRRAGRKRDTARRALAGNLRADMSARSIARFHRALRMVACMRVAGYDCDAQEMMARSVMANGRINVSAFERLAETRLCMAIVDDESPARRFDREWLIKEFGL